MIESDSPARRHPANCRELKEEFAVADRNGDGRIEFEEFTRLLLGLEAGMSQTDLRIGFHEIDTDTDGLIDFQEFADWWSGD